jgi:Bacterial Ig-like domain (group 3)
MPHRARIGTVVALGAAIITALVTTLAVAQTETATQTSLTAETREIGGQTVATFTATVLGANGRPASGAVVLRERGHDLAGAALNPEGKAEILLNSLATGDHAVQAVYQGNTTASSSQSEVVSVHPQATATPDFSLAIAPATFTLKAGAAGTLVATVLPTNGFTGFISLSCSGTSKTTTSTSLPVGVSCVFSPTNLQVTAATVANPTGAVKANMSLQTTAPAGQNGQLRTPANAQSPLFLAVLIPGALGLGFLGRKRKLLGRTALLLMLGAIAILGTSACSARYGYFHHPPTANDGTPLGTYTLTVTAQTSNGVTATSHSMPLALTVN